MEEDPDIEILKAKKMQEIMQRMMKQKKKDNIAISRRVECFGTIFTARSVIAEI